MATLRRWYVAIALFIALLLDGVVSWHFQGIFFKGSGGAACWFTVVGITLIGLCDDRNINNVWLALGAGVIADCYYLGFLGVYSVIFPLICWLSESIARYFPETFLSRTILCMCTYTLVNLYVFLVFHLVKVTNIPLSQLWRTLVPSLLLCFIITLITYHFWVWLVEKYPFLVRQRIY